MRRIGITRCRVCMLLLSLLAVACARKPDAPSAAGETCRTHDDCNRTQDGGARTCGVLRLCVAGHCEATHDGGPRGSRVVACADAGTR